MTRFVNIDRNTPLLLPPDLRDWVPPDHLVHFILDAVESLDLREAKVNVRGTGSPQYPPTLLLSLLIYCYATGLFGSRRIERATFDSVPLRLICAGTHPDHDTICTFRRENGALLRRNFVKVLEMAKALQVLKVGQITVSVDGTKIEANASKHAAVSYERAGQMTEQLDLEVQALMKKAEQADSTPLEDGLSIPQEIQRRQERKAKLEQARVEIERRALEKAQAQADSAKSSPTPPPPPPPAGAIAEKQAEGSAPQAAPDAKDQYNFTDPDSRIMKTGSGKGHFEQCYNAQAAVEVDSRLIVGERVSQSPNDKKELGPTLSAIPDEVVDEVGAVLTDSGFYSEAAVQTVEQTPTGEPTGTVVYAAMEKKDHHRTVADLEKRDDPAPAPGAKVAEVMSHRLKTKAGRALYKLRQQTVEPVFGIVKEAMGFRRFMLRGKVKVAAEWTLVCIAYNLRRLHRVVPVGAMAGLSVKVGANA